MLHLRQNLRRHSVPFLAVFLFEPGELLNLKHSTAFRRLCPASCTDSRRRLRPNGASAKKGSVVRGRVQLGAGPFFGEPGRDKRADHSGHPSDQFSSARLGLVRSVVRFVTRFLAVGSAISRWRFARFLAVELAGSRRRRLNEIRRLKRVDQRGVVDRSAAALASLGGLGDGFAQLGLRAPLGGGELADLREAVGLVRVEFTRGEQVRRLRDGDPPRLAEALDGLALPPLESLELPVALEEEGVLPTATPRGDDLGRGRVR